MMTDAVLVIDRKGTISFSNRAARDAGLDAKALIGPTGVISLRELPLDWEGEFDVARPAGTPLSEVEGPASRDVDFRNEIRDASDSAQRNIAEGFGRYSPPQFVNFRDFLALPPSKRRRS